MKSETRKIDRTPEDMAHLKAIREKFKQAKPSLKLLVKNRPYSIMENFSIGDFEKAVS